MQRASLFRLCSAALIGVAASAGYAGGQTAPASGAVGTTPLSNGLRGALAAVGDRVTPDRSQFLLEFIRRTYNRPVDIKNRHRDAAVETLVGQIERGSAGVGPEDSIPLPLSPDLWMKTAFKDRETAPRTLIGGILQSRGASLLYYGLVSLDDETRAWLAQHPSILEDIASHQGAAFVAAAPGLRIRDGSIAVPGGTAAQAGWEAVVDRRRSEPESFIRALLSGDEGRLALFYGAMSQLAPDRLAFALGLDGPDEDTRTSALRRLRTVFDRAVGDWKVDDGAFWRPAVEPVLLAAHLPADSTGQIIVPGTRQFWNVVFAADEPDTSPRNGGDSSRGPAGGDPVDFVWLAEQVFSGPRLEYRQRYMLVLFAARILPRLPNTQAADAVAAVRAARLYPSLASTLDRANVTDVSAFAAAARRARRLGAIPDQRRATRALSQFQGALSLATQGTIRGSLRPDALASHVIAMSAVEHTEQGNYEGRMVRWLVSFLDSLSAQTASELEVPTAGAVERDLISVLAGPVDRAPRFVEWEGTRYRLDFARAEAVRLTQLLGENPLPYLSSARAAVAVADALTAGGLSRSGLQEQVAALQQLAEAVALDRSESWRETDTDRLYRDAAASLRRAANGGDTKAASRLAPAILELADDLLARGLRELVYAVALGDPDRSPITADDAARRHEFAPLIGAFKESAAWSVPASGIVPAVGWRVTGSLLGLDVRLAEFSLRRLSARPPARRPMLDDDRRRVLVETVVLADPRALADESLDIVAAALQRGRARMTNVTAADAGDVADAAHLSPMRRTLLAWISVHDRERLAAFLSPLELLWVGLEGKPAPDALHAFGSPAEPRTGCLCLRMPERRPWEVLAGRWHSGMLSSGFPDLNLRVAELLKELQMPASLLAPVLAAATLDLVDTAAARDPDDRRALVEVVHDLRAERVEQYLALLTADGPLVPVRSGAER